MFTSASSPQDAFNKALALCEREKPRILFYPQPQRTLPKIVK
jgi:hypothetical protein